MDITHMDTDTTLTAITDRIPTMATIMGLHIIGTAGIAITATTVIITIVIIGNKLT
jgi:Mg2+/Co2+ transporter CorB